jgi:copper chaperone CopZ
MKNLLGLAVLAVFLFSCSLTKNGDGNKDTARISTNAECGMCKEKIEGKLNYEKGIVFAELDVPSKVVTVKYKKDVISQDEIRKIISELGYDADEVKANESAQNNLPACCKPGGMK